MKGTCFSALVLLGVTVANAQLYVIPDDVFGAALDDVLPNAVTYDPVPQIYTLDTQHPDVLGLAHLEFPGPYAVNDYNGIQYFTSLRYLDLSWQHGTQLTPVSPATLPSSLDTLIMHGINANNDILLRFVMNDSLEYIDMSGSSVNSIPGEIAGLPMLRYLDLSDHAFNTNYTVPALPNTLEYIDISRYTNSGSVFVQSFPVLPDSLRVLKVHNIGLESLGPLPDGLLHLDVSTENPNLFGGLTNLPALPVGLRYLNARRNPELIAVPYLPDSLRYLDISYCNMDSVPGLPPFLEYFDWRGVFNGIDQGIVQWPATLKHLAFKGGGASMPPLPAGLEHLDLYYGIASPTPPLPDGLDTLWGAFVQLDTLPSSLTHLWLQQNPISLPTFPPQLVYFNCSSCDELTSLPAFPSSLVEIDIRNADILPALPDLPAGLQHLRFASNDSLTALPELPDGLRTLRATSLRALACLPVLPNSLEVVQAAFSVECLPNIPGSAITLSPSVVCNIAISSCPRHEEIIYGRVFRDLDQDGVRDPGEPPVPIASVSGQPGSLFSSVDQNGYYLLLPDSNVATTVQGTPLLYHTLTTPPVVLTVPAFGEDSTDIGYYGIPGIHDLVVEMEECPAVPGFDNSLWMQVTNVGTETTAATIDLAFDGDQNWVFSNETPDAQVGNTASWSILLDPGYTWSNTVILHTSAGVALGTPIDHVLTATPQQADSTPANNSAFINTVVVGSYDPNDKLLEPETMTLAEVQAGTAIEYTIRFQNTGTDTAFTVRLEDQLDGDLDWSSFQPVAASHAYRAVIDGDGLATVVFDQIMLPDSNVNEPESHGFFTFRIRALAGLPDFTAVENSAGIFFDFNDAVVTNTTLNTLVPLLPAVISAQPVTCHGGQDGSFSAAPVVGNLPITFTLAGVGSNETGIFQNLAGGLYMLTMEDATGHTVSQPVEIPEPDAIVDSFVLSICQHEPSPATGTVYDVPGDYQEQVTLQTPDGCDSLVVASLVVYPEELLVVDNGPLPYGTVYHGVVLTQDTQFVYFDTTEFGCLLTISENVTVSPSSTNEVTVAIGLSIRPNPVEDYFTVSFETDFPAAVSLRLTDALGRPVRELKPVHTSGIHTYTFDTAELAAGIYFLHLNIGDHWASKILTKI
ncbi:MAG: T9SS type A sorting domain-containing protein [Flavobacteriales bacterium]|nr:T9SS type A sorting domain-containing protein [Flavobacteriales bacterium]